MEKRGTAMKVIGITGGVGAGKSTVVSIIEKHFQTEYLHCDVIAHELMEPGQSAYRELLEIFGEGIKNDDGTINRGRLYEAAFNADRVGELNACVHPKVHAVVEERIAAFRAEGFRGIVLIEAALLIEAGYKEICDELWYVYAPEKLRKERLKQSRGYTEEKAESIMKRQASEKLFFAKCDFVLYNDSAPEDCERHIMEQIIKHQNGR